MPTSSEVPAGVTPVEPGAGQESVWDYPRPPRVEAVPERLRVVVNEIDIADTGRALRVLETAGPPVYYIPVEDVRIDLLESTDHTSYCEWKGDATYRSLRLGDRLIHNVCWTYLEPSAGFEAIRGYLAFYAGRVDEAWVGDELATPQAGHFYGGWITSRITGPFKGEPGTADW
ncbi:MAG: DUF427 domain-containing protein [Candidatus Limnocylindrales bacterium]